MLLRYCDVLAIFPQRFIRHQRRFPGREVSTNISPQFGFSQARIRDRNSPANRSIASRAMRERVAEAVMGEPQTCSKPSNTSCGGRSGAAATRLIVSISSEAGASPCLMASATRQIASLSESAALNSSRLTWTPCSFRGDSESQSARSDGPWNRSQYARFPVSPPVCVKSMHNRPATKINRAHSPFEMDLESGLTEMFTTPV